MPSRKPKKPSKDERDMSKTYFVRAPPHGQHRLPERKSSKFIMPVYKTGGSPPAPENRALVPAKLEKLMERGSTHEIFGEARELYQNLGADKRKNKKIKSKEPNSFF